MSGPPQHVHGLGAPMSGREHAEFLIQAGRRLTASLNVRRCSRIAAELACSFLADTALVVLPAQYRRSRYLRATAAARGVEEGELSLAAIAELPGLAEALAGLTPAAGLAVDPGRVPGWVAPQAIGRIGHVRVASLPGSGMPAGALILIRGETSPPFDADTEALTGEFAVRAGAALSSALLFEEQSRTNEILTSALLPPELPHLEHAELAGSLRASQQAGQIGGDFYDLYWPQARQSSDTALEPSARDHGEGDGRSPDGDAPARPGAHGPQQADVWPSPLIVLGDVCGKGARAALLAGQIRHSLRTLLLVESRPERLIELVNRSLIASPVPDSTVTLVLATPRPAPDGHLLVDLAVAGHPEPLILRADGSVAAVTTGGTMLGILNRIDLATVTVDLAPGELCLLYSDGITEAIGGPGGHELYGVDRLAAALATCAGMPAAAVVQRLEQMTSRWATGGDQDDRALLAIRARPLPHRNPRGLSSHRVLLPGAAPDPRTALIPGTTPAPRTGTIDPSDPVPGASRPGGDATARAPRGRTEGCP
ncbi:PP2C family protein-serine/threonine phosphatase [Sphaerisporangium melleum]|uniref:PP2C family protein-serine/threonine phosphatase n=1 Tax=Sphaerisporangium melleum TaxID=321316 RepID=UPI001E656A23|nr:PP2C family protein-serine/threonine phosphatase [Sphaerisporangium melleum]